MSEPLSEQSRIDIADTPPQQWVVSSGENGSNNNPPGQNLVETAVETADDTTDSPQLGEAQLEFNAQDKKAATFAQERTIFNKISQISTVNLVLEKYQRQAQEAAAAGNPYSQLGSESAAALLLRINELKQANDETPVNSELYQALIDRVNNDPSAAELYYTERFENLTSGQLVQEVASAAAAIAEGASVPGHQLRILMEKSEELKLAADADSASELTKNLDALRAEEQKRTGVIQAMVDTFDSVKPNSADPDLASEFFTKTGLKAEVISRDDDSLVVKSIAPDGENHTTEITKPKLLRTLLASVASDVLFGTNILQKRGSEVLKASIFPLLEKWGIDPSLFLDAMNYKQYDVFDQMFDIMTDQQCEDYFRKSLDNQTLPTVLKQIRPEHVLKIFHPGETQEFITRTSIIPKKHVLTSELVNDMYKSLSANLRRELFIPEPVAPAAS